MNPIVESDKNQIAEQIREALVDSLLSQRPIPLASGKLASSIKVVPVEDGFEIYAEDWWVFVENGRVGHGKFPPILPIMEWIRNKGIKSKTIQKPESLAWAIANNLKTSRIKPRPFIEQGLNSVQNVVADEFELTISKVIDNTFE